MTLDGMSSSLASLHLLRPAWLWLLLALPLLAAWWHRRRRRASAWQGAVDPHLLPALLDARSRRGGRAWSGAGLLLPTYVLAVLALAGPSWRQDDQPLLQTDAPLVIALDLSSATLAGDLPPSRLLQARAKIATLLDRRAGGQVGLVAYADDAYTVAPLTDDAANVALFLDALTPAVMPADGSRADCAIAWSSKLLKQAGFRGGDILLITDHADAAARAAAAQAHGDGAAVSVLGLGTAAGAAFRNPFGEIARARLDANSLRALASAGGGRYAALAVDAGDLETLGVLDGGRLREGVAAAQGDKARVWRDEGYWLLLPLLVLLALAFRRGSALAAVLLVACLPWQNVRAADGTLWRRADQVRQTQMQAGADAYRKQDYAAAQRAWTALPGADAAYNRGNALAKAGRYEDAVAAYDEALRQQPGMADAEANRRAVRDAMKRKPPPAPSKGRGQQKPSQGGKPNDGASSGKDGAPSPPKDGAPPPQNGQSGQGDARDRPPPPPSKTPADAQDAAGRAKPADAEQQRKADAEQRARMQQALQRDAQARERAAGSTAPRGESRVETAAQRERRQANDAWLHRVPDAPGDLLRAKFQLEAERRQESGDR